MKSLPKASAFVKGMEIINKILLFECLHYYINNYEDQRVDITLEFVVDIHLFIQLTVLIALFLRLFPRFTSLADFAILSVLIASFSIHCSKEKALNKSGL